MLTNVNKRKKKQPFLFLFSTDLGTDNKTLHYHKMATLTKRYKCGYTEIRCWGGFNVLV